ncbi:hypothetical protein H4582DRAFT_1328600 [Lactarius indigo]|nr:hypothetical protein H4582DRAFT_1328600 [Lactarius indigo]
MPWATGTVPLIVFWLALFPALTMNNTCLVHSGLFQNTLDNYPFENFFCQCFGSPGSLQTDEQLGDTGVPVYTQLQLDPPASSSPVHSTITHGSTTTEDHWQCHICPESFCRWQDRDRHQWTHIPYFIHCPLPHCAWRGNRADLFKKHWQKEDHRSHHEHYGHTPEKSQIETYDPWEILNPIIDGTISLSEGEVQAIFLVQVKAYELQKLNVWTDPWGKKQASNCRIRKRLVTSRLKHPHVSRKIRSV